MWSMTCLSFFYPPPTEKELRRKWRADIRSKKRELQRALMHYGRERNKAVHRVKVEARKDTLHSVKMERIKPMASEVASIDKVILSTKKSISHLDGILMKVNQQGTSLRMHTTMRDAAGLLSMLNMSAGLPEIQGLAQRLSTEMLSAGLIEESIESIIDTPEDTEEIADDILDGVVKEILSTTPFAPSTELEEEYDALNEDTVLSYKIGSLKA